MGSFFYVLFIFKEIGGGNRAYLPKLNNKIKFFS